MSSFSRFWSCPTEILESDWERVLTLPPELGSVFTGGARVQGFPALCLESHASRMESSSVPGRTNCTLFLTSEDHVFPNKNLGFFTRGQPRKRKGSPILP